MPVKTRGSVDGAESCQENIALENADQKPSILCYVRPWSVDQFRELAEITFKNGQITYTSDFLGLGDICLADEFYRRLNTDEVGEIPEAVNDCAVREDIRCRCRLLRLLNHAEADRMILAMARAIENALDRVKPDYVVSYAVDS
jgi:hypothetical protein